MSDRLSKTIREIVGLDEPARTTTSNVGTSVSADFSRSRVVLDMGRGGKLSLTAEAARLLADQLRSAAGALEG